MLSVVVPTYNERENIGELVRRIGAALKDVSYEIIVVDDDSPDGTAEEARRLSSTFPVRVVVRRGERGLASAVMEGARRARGEVVAVIDADLQHPPEILPQLYRRALGGCGIVVASRYARGGSIRGWSLARRLASKTATLAARLLVPEARRVKDPLSGYFAFRRDSVSLDKLNPRGFKILLELLASAGSVKTCEIPYEFSPRKRGESKLGAKVILEYAVQLARLSVRAAKFATVGASGVAVNLGVLAALRAAALPHEIAAAAATESSILWNFSLHDAWTFRDMRRGAWYKRLVGFHAAVAVGGLTQYAVSVGLYWSLLPSSLLAQLAGIIAGFLANYVASSTIVWKPDT